jgi:hypothetical protein
MRRLSLWVPLRRRVPLRLAWLRRLPLRRLRLRGLGTLPLVSGRDTDLKF